MVVDLCVVVLVVMPVLSMCLHGASQLVDLVVLVVGWFACGGIAVCIMELFSGGS